MDLKASPVPTVGEFSSISVIIFTHILLLLLGSQD